MSDKVQAPQVSTSYTKAVTNFWKNEDNSTFMKIVKFVGAIFAYLFALPLDAATKIGQYFLGTKEKPADKTLSEKFWDIGAKGVNLGKKFISNRWAQAFIASSVLLTAGYYFGFHNKVTGWFSKTPIDNPLNNEGYNQTFTNTQSSSNTLLSEITTPTTIPTTMPTTVNTTTTITTTTPTKK